MIYLIQQALAVILMTGTSVSPSNDDCCIELMLLFVCFMSWCVLQVALSCIYNAAAIKSECCGIGLSEEFKKLIGALPTYSGP